MSELVFVAHIPLLRIDSESVPFAAGDLWRMPFDRFVELTGSAFEAHQADYDETAPVFYRVGADLDLPNLTPGQATESGAIEIKAPSDNWALFAQFGMGYLEGFQEMFVDAAWAGLLLASPGSALPPPRLSVTFVVSTGDAAFELNDQKTSVVRLQGDADQEYLFLSYAAGPVWPAETISVASSLTSLVDEIKKTPELAGALASLLATTSPSLTPVEQLTMSVIALESLLLPEIRSGLGKTFAMRLASLLASSQEQLDRLKQVGTQLYRDRSSALHAHAASESNNATAAIDSAYAQQFLGAAIRETAARLSNNGSVENVRSSLDRFEVRNQPDIDLPQDSPVGLRQFERLLMPYYARTFILVPLSGVSMTAPEGSMLSWAPLIGLGNEDTFLLGGEGSPVVMPLTGPELLGMEEKDIRRDFAAQILVLNQPISVLTTTITKPDDADVLPAIDQLLHARDIGVSALRLGGFTTFHDPELLGAFVYDESLRFRRPTVLRQTLLQMVRNEPEERISAADATRIGPLWQLLANYDANARHAEIDHVLASFRRAFDRRFLSVTARSGLLFSALEAMLGRFRQKSDKVQLEDLVVKLVGADSRTGTWFVKNGRRFRNSIAHGYLEPGPKTEQSLEHICGVLRAAIPIYVSTWVDLADRTAAHPGYAMVQSLQQS